MRDQYWFYFEQLAGLEPDFTVGRPDSGFYLLRRRYTTPNPNPGPGKPRNKVLTVFLPVAVWQDESGWVCVVGTEGNERVYTDPETIDEQVMAYCRRHAITEEEYRRLRNENESANRVA